MGRQGRIWNASEGKERHLRKDGYDITYVKWMKLKMQDNAGHMLLRMCME